jgi:hypothetical protein
MYLFLFLLMSDFPKLMHGSLYDSYIIDYKDREHLFCYNYIENTMLVSDITKSAEPRPSFFV